LTWRTLICAIWTPTIVSDLSMKAIASGSEATRAPLRNATFGDEAVRRRTRFPKYRSGFGEDQISRLDWNNVCDSRARLWSLLLC
jgi:hypothetical protein